MHDGGAHDVWLCVCGWCVGQAESHFAQARAYHRVKNDSTAKFHLRRRRAYVAVATGGVLAAPLVVT